MTPLQALEEGIRFSAEIERSQREVYTKENTDRLAYSIEAKLDRQKRSIREVVPPHDVIWEFETIEDILGRSVMDDVQHFAGGKHTHQQTPSE